MDVKTYEPGTTGTGGIFGEDGCQRRRLLFSIGLRPTDRTGIVGRSGWI